MAGGGFKVHRDGRMSARQEVTSCRHRKKKPRDVFFFGIFWPVLSPPYFVLKFSALTFHFPPFFFDCGPLIAAARVLNIGGGLSLSSPPGDYTRHCPIVISAADTTTC